jgi:hypothetical protein
MLDDITKETNKNTSSNMAATFIPLGMIANHYDDDEDEGGGRGCGDNNDVIIMMMIMISV